MDLLLERFSYAPDGTFGRLVFPDGTLFYTVEPPWLRNTVGRSCIPEGTYSLEKRRSGVVERTTDGEFLEGYEVVNVRGRTYIMLHPANWPDEVEGCIAPGLDYRVISGRQAVSSSRDAFRKVMGRLDLEPSWRLHVTHFEPSYRRDSIA